MGYDPDGTFDWGSFWRGVGVFSLAVAAVAGIALITVATGGSALPVLIGAGIGAVVSGGVSAGCQLVQTGGFDFGRLLTDMAIGGVSGGFGGSALGVLGMTISGSATGFIGSVASDYVTYGSFANVNIGNAFLSGLLGGAISAIGGAGAQNGKLAMVNKFQSRITACKTKGSRTV